MRLAQSGIRLPGGCHENGEVSCADRALQHGDRLRFGVNTLAVIYTPGHTHTDICFVAKDRVFTGDTLLIRGSGRTDFQSGDPGQAFDSIIQQLFVLDDHTLVFSAHDYSGQCVSTIGEEKCFNPRLNNGQTRAGYIQLMNAMDLEKPKKLNIAVPANQQCGVRSNEMLIKQAGVEVQIKPKCAVREAIG